jgi:outer membrane receptor protein involved in Fe transport
MPRHFSRLVLALALGLAAPVAAEALEVRLVDKHTGQGVAGAEVTIVGLPGSQRTDADGRLTWKPDPKPPFVLLIVLPGGRVAKPVQIDKLEAILTVIVEAAVAEEVTVAAGVAASIEATPAAGMTMLSARELQLRGPANLMQAIENVPGVSQVSEGQAAVPAVRGLARGRTLLLVDGSRVTSERRVGPSATFLDPSVAEGIDIARGPGSVAYGSDALGGVISVRTRRPSYTGLQASGALTVGAGVPDRRGDGSVSKGLGVGGILFAAHARGASDYSGPSEDVLNSGWSDYGFLARGERLFASGLFTASWQSDFGRDIERPRNNSNQVRFYYPFDDSHRFNTSFARSEVAGFDTLHISGFFGTGEQRTDQDRIPTATRARDIVRADIESKDVQFRLTGDKRFERATVEVGADLNGRYGLEAHDILIQYNLAGDVVSNTDNLSIDSARRIGTGIFAQVEAPLGALASVKGGIRGDYVSNTNEGGYFGDRSVSNGAAAGFAAFTTGPFKKFVFFGQISRGFRDPTLSDRFFRGPSGRGFITGNPDLEPETSLQVDYGARYATSRLRFAGYGYHYRIRNLVERYQTEPDFFFFRNRGEARIRGMELEAQAEVGHGIGFELAAQIGRGHAVDDDADLDDISPDTFSVLVRKAFGTRASAFVRLAIYADDDRPGPSEVEAPGHTNLDLGASWSIHRRVELRGAVRNLLNDEYYASPDPRFVAAPGINGFVTVAFKY